MNADKPHTKLARKLGTYDATLIVMGGVIGSGIFMNPSVVAKVAHTTPLILFAWGFGGLFALMTGYIFADLARLRPDSGGLYGYVRDGFHPVVGFMYGWTALLVSQSGGMAAAGITFAAYFSTFVPFHVSGSYVAAAAIVLFSAINCFGVREGGTTQNIFMVLKIAAIALIVIVALVAPIQPHTVPALGGPTALWPMVAMMAAALVPVCFAYDGCQTAPLLDHEVKDPGRTFPRALVIGVFGIVALYMGITIAALRVLGPGGLAASSTPISDVMHFAIGPGGERLVAVAIAISTLGFLSNQILVSPRIFFSMADDGMFFRQLAWVHPVSRAPIVAIVATAFVSVVIALWQSYGQVVDYVVSMDFIFFALCTIALFTMRRRGLIPKGAPWRIPLHPFSTFAFIALCAGILLATCVSEPKVTLIGIGILCSGIPIYFLWQFFEGRKRVDVPVT